MEAGKDGSRRIGRLFFCNPYSSWQKGRVENNHRILRRVLPRGTSFDSLDQDRVNLPVPHVNSMPRAEYNDVPALETFGKTVGEEALQRLGIRPVPPGQVVLAPKPLGLSPPSRPLAGGYVQSSPEGLRRGAGPSVKSGVRLIFPNLKNNAPPRGRHVHFFVIRTSKTHPPA